MSSIASTGETVLTPEAPFQAERVTHFSRNLSNGTQILKETHESIARDSQGRFYDSSQATKVGGRIVSSPAILNEIVDPVDGKMSSWSTTTGKGNQHSIFSNSHIVISSLPLPRDGELHNLKGDDIRVTTEDLGTKTIAGLQTTGTRTTTLIPQGRIGNTAPLTIVVERWTSPDLKLTISETETDPINGTRTSEFISATRTEPPASLFKIPDNIEFHNLPGGGVMGGIASPPPPPPHVTPSH